MKAIFLTATLLVFFGNTVAADIIECTFDRLTLRGHYSDTDAAVKESMGNSFRIDMQRNLIFVEWDRGVSAWMKPDKMSKNSTFTAYIFLVDVDVRDADRQSKGVAKRKIKISYRLFSDGNYVDVLYDPGERYNPRGARYSCS